MNLFCPSGLNLRVEDRQAAVLLVSLLFLFTSSCTAQQSETAKMLQAANSGSGQSRYAAIDDLGESHSNAAEIVPQLEKLLADKDPQVQWRTARALADYGDLAQSAAPGLRKLLSGNDPIVQYHAAVALGKIGDRSDETVDALVAAATSEDARVARAAIAALRHLKPGPQRVMPALEQVLQSDDDAIVLHALEAIVELGGEAVPLLNEALQRPKTAYLACTAIEQIGPPAADTVPALTELLGKTHHSHLLIADLLALASIGPAAESAAPQIVPLLEMPNDKTVPVAAAYALGAIGAQNVDAPLQQALAKDDPFLQMVAAWSLAKLHPDDQAALQQAVDKLTEGLASDDAQIRNAAAKGLQMLQPPPDMVAPALMEVIKDPDPEVSANVVNALAGLGEAVVPRATKALQNPEYRGIAVRVLTQLGPKAGDAVQPLMDAISASADDLDFRTDAQLALAAIGPAAAPAIDVLVEGISSDHQGVRESSLYALRQIGPGASAAVPALVDRMLADDAFDAMAAAWALARIAPGDSDVAGKAVPKLISGLSSPDDTTRLESVDALAVWGPAASSAAQALEHAAQSDTDPGVRAAAEEALARVKSGQ